MKMWKKAASIALVSALTVSMAACGNGGGSDKGSADADTFKIGGITYNRRCGDLWYGSTKRYPACD